MRLMHRILLRLPPETAHHVGMFFLKLWQGMLPKHPDTRSLAIQVRNFPKLRFGSRLGLAAGFDKNAEAIPALSALGFGFLEAGTIVPVAQPGNPKPRIFRVGGQSLVNHLGFNSQGLDAFTKNFLKGKARVGIPVLVNIGKNKDTTPENALEDYRLLVERLQGIADGFVVNLSSPNTPGLRDLQSEAFLEKLSGLFDGSIPVLVKLAPDLDERALISLCEYVAASSRFSGLVLANTSVRLAKEIAGRTLGGLSGPPLLESALDMVTVAREIVKDKKTIVGVGGVSSLEDAKKMRSAGADLVEIYTSFVYHGPRLVREISRSLG